jgi:hypothetical protein
MNVKLKSPPKPEENKKNLNFNGKTIPYPGFEPGTSELASENTEAIFSPFLSPNYSLTGFLEGVKRHPQNFQKNHRIKLNVLFPSKLRIQINCKIIIVPIIVALNLSQTIFFGFFSLFGKPAWNLNLYRIIQEITHTIWLFFFGFNWHPYQI